MPEIEPVAQLSQFSSPNAVATRWTHGRQTLQDAEVYWLSTVRSDGRPHVTPLLGVWLNGALRFCTGPTERKAKNLAENPQCRAHDGPQQSRGTRSRGRGSGDHCEGPGRIAIHRRLLRIEVRTAFQVA